MTDSLPTVEQGAVEPRCGHGTTVSDLCAYASTVSNDKSSCPAENDALAEVLRDLESEIRHMASRQCSGCGSCDGGSGDGLILAAMHIAARRESLPGDQA